MVSTAEDEDFWFFQKEKEGVGTAKDLSHLQVSELQTEDPCAKGEGQDCYQLQKMRE